MATEDHGIVTEEVKRLRMKGMTEHDAVQVARFKQHLLETKDPAERVKALEWLLEREMKEIERLREALSGLARAYRHIVGLDGAYDPALRKAEAALAQQGEEE